MKKALSLILALVLCLSLCACGHTHEFGEWTTVKEATCTEDGLKERSCPCGEKESEAIAATGHQFGEWTTVKEATYMEDGLNERVCQCGEKEEEAIPHKTALLSCPCFDINGIYIDESKEEKGLSTVYLFYTLTAEETNLTATQLLIDVVVNNTNTYNPIMKKDYIPYYTEYYYSAYNENVYVGSSLNVCQVYEIATGDLVEGKEITLQSSDINVEDIGFSINEIKKLNGIEEIAKDLDATVFSEKYDKQQVMLGEVDSLTENAIKNGLNGYYWTFYAYPSSYNIEFSSPNNFSIKSGFGLSNNGTYTVHAGCIVLYYPSNGYEIIVPFTCNADGSPAFDNNGSIMMPTLADQFVVDPDYDGRE